VIKLRKYKVDEWVVYDPFPMDKTQSGYGQRAVILSICEQGDFYDYRIYVEKTGKFKSVKEESLFSLKED
jgi:hypothetical protein|tara:strand:- start:175 stop:384 length:210 start_codon:yes stop_codon:yes gene_type:complete